MTAQKKVKLKIIMPLYNRADLMQKALDSIYAQKVNFKYKILILDDGSTDNGLEIARENKKKYFNIDVVENTNNIGLLKSIFRGQDSLQGAEYFCVLDPDDYWIDTDYLQNAIDFLDNNLDYTIYSSNIAVLDAYGKTMRYIQSNIPYATNSYEGYLKGETLYMPSTQATLFRNVVYNEGVPQKLKDYIEKYSPQGFRADTFRFLSHLKKGLAYFNNKVTAVYNTSSSGIWSDTLMTTRHMQSLLMYLHLAHYYKEDKDFYYKEAFRALERAALSLPSLAIAEGLDVKVLNTNDKAKNLAIVQEIQGVKALAHFADFTILFPKATAYLALIMKE